LLIKYIKSVLWRVEKCLSYIEEARCLKVKRRYTTFTARCSIFDAQIFLQPQFIPYRQHGASQL